MVRGPGNNSLVKTLVIQIAGLMVVPLCAVVVLGCATTPPHSIQAGTYTNNKYQFSLKIPDNWLLTDKNKETFSKHIPVMNKFTIETVFSTEDEKSFIVLAADKTESDWSGYKIASDQLPEILEKKFAEDRRLLLQDPHIYEFEYTLFPDQINNCAGNCPYVTGTITAKNAGISVKVTFQGIFYRSIDNMFSIAAFALVAGPDRHDADMGEFQAIVGSFQPF